MTTATLYVNGCIDSWFDPYGGSTSLQSLQDSLSQQQPADDISVRINSGGGGVVEGLAIADWLATLDKPVTTIVIGACHSIAGPIFMAGSTRLISESSDLMIHPVSGWAEGTSQDMRAYADLMDKYGEKIINIYTAKTGQSADEIRGMMDATTYINADDCVRLGFATGLYTTAQNHADLRLQMVNYASRRPTTPPPTPAPVPIASQSKNNKPAMANENPLSFAGLAKMFQNLAKKNGQPVNLDVTLADDTTVYVDSTADVPASGDKVYTDSTMATAVADGTYTPKDATKFASFTTVNGEVTAVAAAADNSNPDEIAALKAQIEAQNAEIAALKVTNASNAGLAVEVTNLKQDFAEAMSNMSKVLGGQHSKDLDLAGKSGGSIKNIGNTTPDPQSERDEMLARHKARFAPKGAEATA